MRLKISIWMNKDTIIFYLSQYESIKSELTNEQLGRLFRALFEKQLGNEVVLEDDIKIAFNFLNNQLLVDKKKYEEKCARLRENGKKGGAPLGNKNAEKQPKQPKQANAKKTTLNDNDNDNDNVNDNDNDNDIFSYLEKTFGITISGTHLIKIRELLNVYDNEILCYAVDLCVGANKTNLNYFYGIVNNWISSKFKNLKDIKNSEGSRRIQTNRRVLWLKFVEKIEKS